MTDVMSDCWLAYLDLWGFSNHVAKEQPALILDALKDVRAALIKQSELTAHYMFSDSVVLIHAPGGQSDWNVFINAIKAVQRAAAPHGFLFRGAVTTGAMHFSDRVCFGNPLIEAHAIEQNLALPIVVLTEKQRLTMPFRLGKDRTIPAKNGILKGGVIAPPQGDLNAVIEEKLAQTLVSGPPDIALVWHRLKAFYFDEAVT